MTAKGKINASKVQAGDRIIIKTRSNGTVHESSTKTGEFVSVARVTGKIFRAAQGPYERQGKYVIQTSAGSFEAGPIQTMWLAPEDAAGIKRAHAEAMVEDEEFTRVRAAMDEEDEARGECPECGGRLASDGVCADDECGDDLPEEAPTNEEDVAEEPNPTENHTGSTVIILLEKVWSRIRADHPELPEVVIVTGSGKGMKWGHFAAESWRTDGREDRHELFLASEALAKGSRQVIQTMLHEAAHCLSRVRGIKDHSRQGRYHNREFLKAAQEMGLDHRSDQSDVRYGWAFVTLTPSTVEKYADLTASLDDEIRLTGHLPGWLGSGSDEDDNGGERITGKPPAEKKTYQSQVKATCACSEPNIIRLSRKVLDKRVVSCENCGSLFAESD